MDQIANLLKKIHKVIENLGKSPLYAYDARGILTLIPLISTL